MTALIKDLGTYLSPQLPPGGKVSEQGERPAPQGFELRPPTSETLAELPWRVLLWVEGHALSKEWPDGKGADTWRPVSLAEARLAWTSGRLQRAGPRVREA